MLWASCEAQVDAAETRLIELLRWRAQSLVKQLEARHVSEELSKREVAGCFVSLSVEFERPPLLLLVVVFFALSRRRCLFPCVYFPWCLFAFSCALPDWGYVYFQDKLRRPCIVIRACNFTPVLGGGEAGAGSDWRQCVLYLIEEALKSAPIDAEQLTLLIDGADLDPQALPIQSSFNLAALLSTCYSQYLGTELPFISSQDFYG